MEEQPRISRRCFLGSTAAVVGGGLVSGCLSLDLPETRGAPPWQPFRLLHFGGLLLTGAPPPKHGLRNGDSIGLALRAFDLVSDLPATDLMLFSGNLIANERPSDLRVLMDVTGQISRSWLTVPGPSESGYGPGGCDSPAFLSLVGPRCPLDGKRHFAVQVMRNLRLIGLDTTVPGRPNGAVSPQQIEFLKGEIDGHPDQMLVVLTHHPPLPPADENLARLCGDPGEMENGEMLRFVLEAGENVRLVLSGSRSAPEIRSESGLHFVTTPATTAFPAAFREIRVRRRQVEFLYHRLLSPVAEKTARTRLAASPAAQRYNPALPSTFADALAGSKRDREQILPLR